MELIFVVRDIVHQVGLHHERRKLNRSASFTLLDLQQNLRKSIKSAQERLHETESIQLMADGVQYTEGYRVESENEGNNLNRWMEARASVTIEPLHNFKFNSLENNCETNNLPTNTQNDYTFIKSESQHSSGILSEEPIKENRKNRNENEADNDDFQPNIHFDEYSQDYLHALDSITKKGQRKSEESRRRKSYKMFMSGHSDDEILQRRRSEDIDGETDNPWGELKPESFHDDGLWKRERAMSIAENEETMAFVDDKLCHESFKREVKKPLHTILKSIENQNVRHSSISCDKV